LKTYDFAVSIIVSKNLRLIKRVLIFVGVPVSKQFLACKGEGRSDLFSKLVGDASAKDGECFAFAISEIDVTSVFRLASDLQITD
jgi:hypothetical protein